MSSERSKLDWLSSDGDAVQAQVLAAFGALVFYNALELIVLCLARFKRRGSFYFWCLLVASASLIPHCLGFVLLFFRPQISPYGPVTLIIIGWCFTVTGHSLVLWSRLHLVLQSPRLLRALLRLIVIDGVLFHTPTAVLLYGAVSPNAPTFAAGYRVMERIQLVGFGLQECVISGVYVWETAKMLRLRPARQHSRILLQLLAINVVVLLLDVLVVGIEYAGYYAVQVMFKPFTYSIKLKLEYAVLGGLVQIANGRSASRGQGFDTVLSSFDYEAPAGGEEAGGTDCLLGIYPGNSSKQALSVSRIHAV